MNMFILSPETAGMSVQVFLNQVGRGNLEVRDQCGNVVAYVLGPEDRDSLTYAEAERDLAEHHDDLQAALLRRGGITTKKLLEKAHAGVDDNGCR